ncbi:MAG: flagellar motor switch protein FliG [Rhodobacteraceae bacterium]|nr:flagellar motor switch protein FliG [Paracoccaceae bacterium]
MPQDGLPLARITPAQRAVQAPARRILSPQEKAAVIVRYLLTQGTALPLMQLPEHMQAALGERMAALRLVDRATLEQVLAEFTGELESVGLAFPGGLEGAITAMDGHISQGAASRLRRKAGANSGVDPWDRLVALPAERLIPIVEAESVEVAAVILSKLPVPRAAELLGKLPGERARRIAFAVSQTTNVDPATVRRIGGAILAQIDSQPPRAFERNPVERVGAILNISPAATRDEVLRGLEVDDESFAEQVKKAIFTFVHIPQRISPRDVPKVIRLVAQPALVQAVAWAQGREQLEEAVEFLLANMSQRMAQTLREDAAGAGKIKEREAEAAMNQIVGAIRQLEEAGELAMIATEEDEDP